MIIDGLGMFCYQGGVKKPNAFIAMFLVVILTGCGVTLSPNKRKPLEIVPIQSELPYYPKTILVRFRETLPGKPLNETVWDNVSGPIWDVRESKQIGFTQNYANLVALGVVSGVAGGAVGAGAAGAMAPQVVDTRILTLLGDYLAGFFNLPYQSPFPAQQFVLNHPVLQFQIRQTMSWQSK